MGGDGKREAGQGSGCPNHPASNRELKNVIHIHLFTTSQTTHRNTIIHHQTSPSQTKLLVKHKHLAFFLLLFI